MVEHSCLLWNIDQQATGDRRARFRERRTIAVSRRGIFSFHMECPLAHNGRKSVLDLASARYYRVRRKSTEALRYILEGTWSRQKRRLSSYHNVAPDTIRLQRFRKQRNCRKNDRRAEGYDHSGLTRGILFLQIDSLDPILKAFWISELEFLEVYRDLESIRREMVGIEDEVLAGCLVHWV